MKHQTRRFRRFYFTKRKEFELRNSDKQRFIDCKQPNPFIEQRKRSNFHFLRYAVDASLDSAIHKEKRQRRMEITHRHRMAIRQRENFSGIPCFDVLNGHTVRIRHDENVFPTNHSVCRVLPKLQQRWIEVECRVNRADFSRWHVRKERTSHYVYMADNGRR